MCNRSYIMAGLRRGLSAAGALALAAVAAAAPAAAPSQPLRVAATTGMVADLAREVGGDRVEVVSLMGPGVDPHLYKPAARDASVLGAAGVILYSGLMLEGRMGDLFARLARAGKKAYPVTERVPENLLLEPEEFEGHHDPHVWFDVSLWARGVPVVVDALAAADPSGGELYRANGAAVEKRLAALHEWCRARASEIPEARRILVTSHDAYNYFGRAYGFRVVGLQGVSTVSEAALADMAGLVDFIRKQGVKAIFVESSVNPAAIRRVAQDAGVAVGGELFSDAMGAPGEIKKGFDTGTYEGMVRYNMATIVDALK